MSKQDVETYSAQHVALAPGVLLLAMVSIAAGASFAQGLFPAIGPQGVTGLRLTIGALILIVVSKPWRLRFTAKPLSAILVYGAMMGGMNLLFYMSLQTLPLGVAVAIEFIGPLSVAILASRRLVDMLWIALAVAGLALLLPLRGTGTSIDLTGALYALGAAACWAVYIVAGQKAGRAFGNSVTSIGMLVAASMTLPIGIAHAGSALLDPSIIAIAVVVAILSSALPFSLEMFALRNMSSTTYGTLISAEPAIGAVAGFILLGQVLPVEQWAGIALVAFASLGTSLSAIRDRSRSTQDVSRASPEPV